MPSANHPCPSPSAVRPYSSASIRKKCSPGTPCMEVLKMQESQTSSRTLNQTTPCFLASNGVLSTVHFDLLSWTSKLVVQISLSNMGWLHTTVNYAVIRGSQASVTCHYCGSSRRA